MSFCKYCNLDLNTLPKNQRATHSRWCKSKPPKEVTYLLKCSCTICKKEISAQGLPGHYNSHNKILTKTCKLCGKLITNDKMFCNSSCSATFNNSNRVQSLETRQKISNSNKLKVHSVKTKLQVTPVRQCIICNRYFKKTGNTRTCSKICKSAFASQSIKKAIYNGTFNPNKNRGRGKQSYLEKSFQDWLDNKFPSLEYITEMKFKRLDMIKTYYADFYFPSKQLIIELDGTQHLTTKDYDDSRDLYISTTYNLTILRISHEDYVSKKYISYITKLLS